LRIFFLQTNKNQISNFLNSSSIGVNFSLFFVSSLLYIDLFKCVRPYSCPTFRATKPNHSFSLEQHESPPTSGTTCQSVVTSWCVCFAQYTFGEVLSARLNTVSRITKLSAFFQFRAMRHFLPLPLTDPSLQDDAVGSPPIYRLPLVVHFWPEETVVVVVSGVWQAVQAVAVLRRTTASKFRCGRSQFTSGLMVRHRLPRQLVQLSCNSRIANLFALCSAPCHLRTAMFKYFERSFHDSLDHSVQRNNCGRLLNQSAKVVVVIAIAVFSGSITATLDQSGSGRIDSDRWSL
jgi:hypothetical protein